MRFDDKVVLVTGGASGIGRATCIGFAAAGGRVFVTDVDAVRGAETVAEIEAANGEAEFIRMDVTDAESVAAAAEFIAARAGRLDVLVNAAGWDIIEPFLENSAAYMDKVVALNFMGPVKVAKGLLPLLIDSGSGRIVNVASDAGRVGSSGETVYAGAKGAVIAFTKSLAREVTRNNVRVNCVCPGPTDTPLFATQSEKMREALVRAIPMRRLGRADEVADAILFLASNRASFITGQVLSVSGGLTMAG